MTRDYQSIEASRAKNVEIFQDTLHRINTDPALRQIVIDAYTQQRVILGQQEVEDFAKRNLFVSPAILKVTQNRTLEAAQDYVEDKVKICILNFASANNPGGGVKKGSTAQEEALCRISTLYPCLNQQICWNLFYTPHRNARDPLHNNDCIYTPNVLVFKQDDHQNYPLDSENMYFVDVISCAAPNLRENPSNSFNPGDGFTRPSISNRDLEKLHVSRFKRILDLACAHHVEVLILGAFGCGVFKNPPDVVAHAFKQLLPDYQSNFKVIEFAIYSGRNVRNVQNYRVFHRILVEEARRIS